MFSAVVDSVTINPDDVALVRERLYDLTPSEKLERLGGMWADAVTPYWRDVITYVAEGIVDYRVVDRQVLVIDPDSTSVEVTSSPVLTEPWTSRFEASDDEQIAEYSHGPNCYVGRNLCECKIGRWSDDEPRSDDEWLTLKQDWFIRKGCKARRINDVLYVNTVAIYPDGHFKCKAGRCKYQGHLEVAYTVLCREQRYVASILAHYYAHSA